MGEREREKREKGKERKRGREERGENHMMKEGNGEDDLD